MTLQKQSDTREEKGMKTFASRSPKNAPLIVLQDVGSTQAISMLSVVLQACGLWLATRLALVVLTCITTLFAASHSPTLSLPPAAFLQAWNHADTGFFLAIAYYGYYSTIPIVYYPVYPLLIHIGAGLVGVQYQLPIALLISNAGTLAGFIGLGILAVQEGLTEAGARNVVRIAAAYPLAFFLFAPYTEGAFLAFAVWCLVFMRRGAWYRAALCAFIAGLTRPTAVILILPLAWEYGRQQGWWTWLRSHWHFWRWYSVKQQEQISVCRNIPLYIVKILRALVVIEAVPLAVACYALYCKIRFDNPWAFVQSEQLYWFHRPMPPWTALNTAFTMYATLPAWSYNQARFLLDLLPWLLFVLFTLIAIRRIPFAFTLYMFGLLQLCIAAPVINANFPFVFMSTGRYLLVSIPIFLQVSKWIERYPWLDPLIISIGFVLQGALTVLYLQGGWIV